VLSWEAEVFPHVFLLGLLIFNVLFFWAIFTVLVVDQARHLGRSKARYVRLCLLLTPLGGWLRLRAEGPDRAITMSCPSCGYRGLKSDDECGFCHLQQPGRYSLPHDPLTSNSLLTH
jgi:hypothetical protein